MTYLITFACYGCHLHGSASGSVDRHHNKPGTPVLLANTLRHSADTARMDQAPYLLDAIRGEAILATTREVCAYRGWALLAVQVRTTHVHLVIRAQAPPERVMSDIKAYSSRRLNALDLDEPDRKRWARHGSTRWLWKPEEVAAAIQYVAEEQGAPMSVYREDDEVEP
ncbi:transposase [Paludibaculum fermentans]|uniref:transposase n=1 Tax=Paludibaculum fermentans TaxID=1473598 RepID=UPI003EBAF04B